MCLGGSPKLTDLGLRGYKRLNPPQRTLFGPDLSNPSPRALQGLIASIEGAHDADFLRVLSEAQGLAAAVFQLTDGEVAILPTLEEAAPEAVAGSLLPPGAKIAIGVCGAYGERMAKEARSQGFAVTTVEAGRGEAVPVPALIDAVRRIHLHAIMLMHGEGSTGVLQPLDEVGAVCRQHNTLLLVDTSFTLAGADFRTTEWEVDAAWSGTQRCLSAVAGLTLVALSPRAVQQLRAPATGYLHLRRALDGAYDSFPAPLLYALDEVLQLCSDQGLAYRFSRIANRQQALIAGVEALGLEVAARPDVRLPSVTAVRVPRGVDGEEVRRLLLARFRLEIGGPVDSALGPVWRVGIMGHSAAPANILLLLSALEVLLEEQKWTVHRGAGVRAALSLLEW